MNLSTGKPVKVSELSVGYGIAAETWQNTVNC